MFLSVLGAIKELTALICRMKLNAVRSQCRVWVRVRLGVRVGVRVRVRIISSSPSVTAGGSLC